MRIRHGRMIAASLLSAGLLTWSGCSTENPDGTPTTAGKLENTIKKDAKIVGDEIKKDAKIVGDKVKEGAKAYGDEAKKDIDKVKEGTEKAGKRRSRRTPRRSRTPSLARSRNNLARLRPRHRLPLHRPRFFTGVTPPENSTSDHRNVGPTERSAHSGSSPSASIRVDALGAPEELDGSVSS